MEGDIQSLSAGGPDQSGGRLPVGLQNAGGAEPDVPGSKVLWRGGMFEFEWELVLGTM